MMQPTHHRTFEQLAIVHGSMLALWKVTVLTIGVEQCLMEEQFFLVRLKKGAELMDKLLNLFV
jgi:hypothetical protein